MNSEMRSILRSFAHGPGPQTKSLSCVIQRWARNRSAYELNSATGQQYNHQSMNLESKRNNQDGSPSRASLPWPYIEYFPIIRSLDDCATIIAITVSSRLNVLHAKSLAAHLHCTALFHTLNNRRFNSCNKSILHVVRFSSVATIEHMCCPGCALFWAN